MRFRAGFVLLLLGLWLGGALSSPAKQMTLRAGCREISLHTASFYTTVYGWFDVYLTTYDYNLPAYPLVDYNTGAVSGELKKVGDVYAVDYIMVHRSTQQWWDWGCVLLTIPEPDANSNGWPDVVDWTTAYDSAISGNWYSADHTSGTVSGRLTRTSGQNEGSYSLKLYNTVFGTISVASTHTIAKATGTITYNRTGNTGTADFAMDVDFGGVSSYTASSVFTVFSDDRVDFPDIYFHGTTSNFILFAFSIPRDGNRYTSLVLFNDCGLSTYWADYQDWGMEWVDSNDSDGEGVPDFSDVDREAPTITVTPSAVTLAKGAPAPNLLQGVTASDTVDGNITTRVVVGGTVNTAAPGNYVITYNVQDLSGNAAAQKSRTYTVNKLTQAITFAALSAKAYGDATFDLSATATSGLGVSFVSQNTAVATISGSTLTIKAAGSAQITAQQPGNGDYYPAPDVSRTLTVNKKAVSARADDKARTYGTANPTFTVSYTGLATGDSGGDIDTPPTVSCGATLSSLPGTYPITLGHNGTDNNYTLTAWQNGILTVTNAPPVIQQVGPLYVTMDEDGSPVTWASPFVSATDDGAGTLTWSISEPAAHGTANAAGSGTSPSSLFFDPAQDWSGVDDFTLRVADPYGGEDAIAVVVTVRPVNDPPFVLLGAGVEFAKGGGEVRVADSESMAVGDVDSPPQLTSASVAIRNLLDQGNEFLASTVTRRNIAASYTPSTGVLSLTGADTVGNYEDVLRGITYVNVEPDPDTTPRLIDVSVIDGGTLNGAAVTTVFITDDTQQLQLQPGWNLLSLPFDAAPWRAPQDILSDGNRSSLVLNPAWGWNDQTHRFDRLDQEVTAMLAFWVCAKPGATPATTAAIQGRFVGSTVELLPGWNLVGPVQDVPVSAIGGLKGVVFRVWYWDTAARIYRLMGDDGVLRRGAGYWFYIKADGSCLVDLTP